MRLLIDTNVLVSAILSRAGAPRRLLDFGRARVFELCTSEVLLAELQEVLGRAKFAHRLAQAALTPQDFTDELRRLATVVAPTDVPRTVPTDADDDHVLAAALSGGCDLVVSGDRRDLLPLASHAGIAIVTARQALEYVEQKNGGG